MGKKRKRERARGKIVAWKINVVREKTEWIERDEWNLKTWGGWFLYVGSRL